MTENTSSRSNFKIHMISFFRKNFAFLVLIALCVVATIIDSSFLSYNVLLGRIQGYCMIGIAALGMTFVILTGGMDLSLGGVGCICGFFAAFLENVMGGYISILAAIVAGACIGLINGLLVTKAKAPPFVITLATMSACNGFALIINNESALQLMNRENALWALAQNNFLNFPIMVWCFLILVVICVFVSKYTKFGRSVYAVGGNEEASRMMGFNPERVKTLCYVISAAFSRFAGAMLCSRLGVAQVQSGANWTMQCLSAVVIGGTLLEGGRGSFFGTFCGVLIYSVIEWMLGRLNMLSWWIAIITGLILLAVVLLQYRNTRVFAKKKKIKKTAE